MKAIINKERKWGVTVSLLRTGHPDKLIERTRRKLIREAAKRPTARLKDMQEHRASIGHFMHVTTMSHILHMSRLWGKLA